MASFKQSIHYYNYHPQKQHMDLATHVLEQTSQIYYPFSFSQSIATLCPPSIIASITFSLRGLACHVTGNARTCAHSRSRPHLISRTQSRSCSHSISRTHARTHSHIRIYTRSNHFHFTRTSRMPRHREHSHVILALKPAHTFSHSFSWYC